MGLLYDKNGRSLNLGGSPFDLIIPPPPLPTFTLRDDFDGTAGSTTSYGDAVWLARYTEAGSNSGYSISVVGGEELSVAYNTFVGQYNIGIGNGFNGDFTMTAKCRYTVNGTGGESSFCGIQLAYNAIDGPQNTYISMYGNGATRELRSQGGSIAFAPTSFYLRIRREGINTWMEYSTDNVTYNELSTYTASFAGTYYLGLFGSYFGFEATSFYDWIEIVTNEDIEA